MYHGVLGHFESPSLLPHVKIAKTGLRIKYREVVYSLNSLTENYWKKSDEGREEYLGYALKNADDNDINFNLDRFGKIYSATSKACLWSLPKVLCPPGEGATSYPTGMSDKGGAKDYLDDVITVSSGLDSSH